MMKWRIAGMPLAYSGGADPSADVSGGYRVDLVAQDGGGDTTKINVEVATSARRTITANEAIAAVHRYLDEETPPSRIVLGGDGEYRAD